MTYIQKKIRIEVYRNGGEFAWNRVVSHVNTEIWEQHCEDNYCPYCGDKEVWLYYSDDVAMNSYICTSCRRAWTMIRTDLDDDDNLDRRNQRLEQLGKD